MIRVWNVTMPYGIKIYSHIYDWDLVIWQAAKAKDLGCTVANLPTESFVDPAGFSLIRFAQLYGFLRSQGFDVAFWVDKWAYKDENYQALVALLTQVWKDFGDDVIYNVAQELDAVWEEDPLAQAPVLQRLQATHAMLRNFGASRIWSGGRTPAGTLAIRDAVPNADYFTYTIYHSVDAAFLDRGGTWDGGFFAPALHGRVLADVAPIDPSRLLLVEVGWPSCPPWDEDKQAEVFHAVRTAAEDINAAGIGIWAITDFWDTAGYTEHQCSFGVTKRPGAPKVSVHGGCPQPANGLMQHSLS